MACVVNSDRRTDKAAYTVACTRLKLLALCCLYLCNAPLQSCPFLYCKDIYNIYNGRTDLKIVVLMIKKLFMNQIEKDIYHIVIYYFHVSLAHLILDVAQVLTSWKCLACTLCYKDHLI